MDKVIAIGTKTGRKRGEARLSPVSGPAGTPDFFIERFEVVEKYRGKGWGTKLLKMVNEHLDETGSRAFLYNVMQGDDPARDIYKNNGWRPSYTNPGRFDYIPRGSR